MMRKTVNHSPSKPNPSLRMRVEARKLELENALANLATDDRGRANIQHALDEVSGLLTGNLDQIPRVVAAELNTWLEANKYLEKRAKPAKTKH
jgi:hypothetical protein